MGEMRLVLNPTIFPTAVQVVLFVSDQTGAPVSWNTSFQDTGFTTVLETPENALQTCKVVDPALSVVDTNLSHAKRLEFCTALRTVASGPILLLVPDYDSKQMADIYNIGVDECLLKPISPAFLVIKAISWLLRRRWLGHDSRMPYAYTSI
jgi:DNA-binding response OmpR family regulator